MRLSVLFFFSVLFSAQLYSQELSISATGSLDPEFSRVYLSITVSNIPNEQIAPAATNLLNRQVEIFFTGTSKTKPVMINRIGTKLSHITSATWSPTSQTLPEANSSLSSITVTGTLIPTDTWSDFSHLAAGADSVAMAAVFVPYDLAGEQLTAISGVSLDLHDFSVPINWNKPIVAPEISVTKAIHKGFFIKWLMPDNITYSNVSADADEASTELGSQEEPFPDEVIAVSFPLSSAPNIFEGISFDPANPRAGTSVSCTYITPPTDLSDEELQNTGWACVDCASEEGTAHAYLPYLTEDLPYTVLRLTSLAPWTKTGLDINIPYVAFLQYPKGLARSTCRLITTTENFTVSEINGGSAAVESDPRCFIATAAFGTAFSKELDTLRWFRDHYLLSWSLGRQLVDAYYAYSPQMAELVASSPTAQTLTRGALYPVVWLILLEQSLPGGSLLLVFILYGASKGFLRRRHNEHSS